MPVDHDFADPGLLDLALTHASTGKARDNERMEFLGDAVLDVIIAEELYLRHPDLAEGGLTELKAHIVSRRTLAEAARRLGLENDAMLGRGLDHRTLSRSVMANLYEAVLGAIYLDSGLGSTRVFVRDSLGPELDRVGEHAHQRPAAAPKQLLQELCQREQGCIPRYELLDTRGEAHARAFLIAARLGARRFPSAWGRNRKEAESWAAVEALFELEEENPA